MRTIVGASLVLATLAVAFGLSGAALAHPGAAVDGSVSVSSVDGSTLVVSSPASNVVPFFWDDDDEDDDDDDADEKDEDDDAEEEDEDEDDGDPPDHAGPPDDDDDEEDVDEEDESQEDDDPEADDPEDGGDTPPPSTATSSPPPEPASITPDSLELPPAQFDVSAATDTNATLIAGDTVRIDVRVENVGLQDGGYEVGLLVDGQTVDNETVEIGAGAVETWTFERRFDEPGEYELALENTSLGAVTVAEVPPMGASAEPQELPHSIAVVTANAPADWVREGHRTTVRTTLVNLANRTASRTFTVTANGRPVAVETVTMGSNEVGVYSIDFVARAGPVGVDGVDAGRIEVGQTVEAEGQSIDDAVAEQGIYLGGLLLLLFVTVVVALTGAAGHVVRRGR